MSFIQMVGYFGFLLNGKLLKQMPALHARRIKSFLSNKKKRVIDARLGTALQIKNYCVSPKSI